MKFAIVALVLLAGAASVSAGCDQAGLAPLTQALQTCVSGGPTAPHICGCYKTYEEATKNIGCPPATQAGIVQGCEAVPGCTESLCGGPIVNNCNSTALAKCGSEVQSCIQSDPTGMCACEGHLVGCYQDLGCGATIVQAASKGCLQAGCPATDCDASAGVQALDEIFRL